jgi:ribosomal protein S18 acetylase RimI-like enzyme
MTEGRASDVEVVDLYAVTPMDLEALWQDEATFWRQCLLWDIADALAVLRRLVGRRSLSGKAVRVGKQTVGYAYYGINGGLGVIANLVVAPAWNRVEVGEALLYATLEALRQRGVSRIESRWVTSDAPWLVPACERWGCQTYWREFMCLDLRHAGAAMQPLAGGSVEPWQGTSLGHAAALMQAAYAGSIDTEINALYETFAGCQLVLDHLLNQGGCGPLVLAASAVVREGGQSLGGIVITETAPRQGHLAQVMVQPSAQRRGLGRLLVTYSASQLAARDFATLSLFVSQENHGARALYQALGWRTVLKFPVFVWKCK